MTVHTLEDERLTAKADDSTGNIIEAKGIKTYFPIRGGVFRRTIGHVKAVDNVDIFIKKGETLGIVGESGSGKTTFGRTLLRLLTPTDGQIVFNGHDITYLSKSEMRKHRRHMQMVFQDPYASLNQRMRIGELIEEPMYTHNMYKKSERKERVKYLLETVGLPMEATRKFPHEFSGGQRQRIGIARSLAINPQLVIADEPVSALDVSVQSQVLNLMSDLQEEFNLTYLFIAHDLSVVKHISDRIGVMYLGKMMELSPKKDLYVNPLHPYTKALLSSIPKPNPKAKKERIVLKGDIPNPSNPPSGCVFRTRCPEAYKRCKEVVPAFVEVERDHFVACHLYHKSEEKVK
ncbi:ABC transporter ATP-binding protein [Evansella clarkii]|uniref:ABC transporter ATP-binding protein n=1 Tax=Evansella clarkii TaxID=79879 RepID=UPI001EEE6382|nr:dipeptide ABC transporter ATP-binding protein [Evansella clarkii]